MYALECPTHIYIVLITAYKQSNCRIIIRAFQQLIHGIYIII